MVRGGRSDCRPLALIVPVIRVPEKMLIWPVESGLVAPADYR
jgi:hypothetical protein